MSVPLPLFLHDVLRSQERVATLATFPTVVTSEQTRLKYLHHLNPNVLLLTGDGIFYDNSSVGFRDISDGTTQTLMLGETLYGLWGDGNSCCARVRQDHMFFGNYFSIGSGSGDHYFGFGSHHG